MARRCLLLSSRLRSTPVARTNYVPAICSERSLAMRDFQPRPLEKSTYFLRAPMLLSLANGMTRHCGAYAQVRSKAAPFGFAGFSDTGVPVPIGHVLFAPI